MSDNANFNKEDLDSLKTDIKELKVDMNSLLTWKTVTDSNTNRFIEKDLTELTSTTKEILKKVDAMQKELFILSPSHNALVEKTNDHEKRIRIVEQSVIKHTVISSIVVTVVVTVLSLVIKSLIG